MTGGDVPGYSNFDLARTLAGEGNEQAGPFREKNEVPWKVTDFSEGRIESENVMCFSQYSWVMVVEWNK